MSRVDSLFKSVLLRSKGIFRGGGATFCSIALIAFFFAFSVDVSWSQGVGGRNVSRGVKPSLSEMTGGGSSSSRASLSEDQLKTYRLNAGDELMLTVFSLPELPSLYVVQADGTIFHTVAGSVKVKGLTLEEARHSVSSRLTKELRNPSFNMSVVRIASSFYSTAGEIVRKGRRELMAGGTNVIDAIADGGGVSPAGDPDRAVIFRGRESIDLDVYSMLKNPEVDPFVMEAGDILYIPEGIHVTVNGQVKTPGTVTVGTKTTPREVIYASGGHTPTAALGRVRLIRQGYDEPIFLDLNPIPRFEAPREFAYMEKGDQLVIEEKKAVVVSGGTTLAIPLMGGETLFDILGEKSVTSEKSNLARVKIIKSSVVLPDRAVGLATAQEEEVEGKEYPVEDINLKYALRDGDRGVLERPVEDGDLIVIPHKGRDLMAGGVFNLIFMARSLLSLF